MLLTECFFFFSLPRLQDQEIELFWCSNCESAEAIMGCPCDRASYCSDECKVSFEPGCVELESIQSLLLHIVHPLVPHFLLLLFKSAYVAAGHVNCSVAQAWISFWTKMDDDDNDNLLSGISPVAIFGFNRNVTNQQTRCSNYYHVYGIAKVPWTIFSSGSFPRLET